MRIGLVLITYARMDMLEIVINRLMECRGMKDMPVFIAHDGGSESVRAGNYMAELAAQNKWEMRLADKRLGLPVNFATGIKEAFEKLKVDAVIVGEDDILPSLDCIEFLKWGLEHFKNDPDIFGIASHSPNMTADGDDNDIRFRPKLNWMFGAIYKRWFDYFYRYWLKHGYPAKGIWSIDSCTDNCLIGSKKLVAYPWMARSTHIGWYGTNMTRKEAEQKKVNNINSVYTRCRSFNDDHKVDKYKISNKADGFSELKNKRVIPHDKPWDPSFRNPSA